MLYQQNSKKQGTVGIGQAIAYFTSIGATVSVPLNDSQKYDLVVDDGTLKRISVKTSRFKEESGAYTVVLKQSGGSRKSRQLTTFHNSDADLLFIFCEDDSRYLIPCSCLTVKHGITLGTKYQKYRL